MSTESQCCIIASSKPAGRNEDAEDAEGRAKFLNCRVTKRKVRKLRMVLEGACACYLDIILHLDPVAQEKISYRLSLSHAAGCQWRLISRGQFQVVNSEMRTPTLDGRNQIAASRSYVQDDQYQSMYPDIFCSYSKAKFLLHLFAHWPIGIWIHWF